jgi:hypothetical protein
MPAGLVERVKPVNLGTPFQVGCRGTGRNDFG